MIEVRRVITIEDILLRITEEEIFRYYIPSLKNLDEAFCSELRNDERPTCRVTQLDKGVYYKDFATGEFYGCFQYVMKLYGYNFGECLNKVASDFNLDFSTDKKGKLLDPNNVINKIRKKNVDIKIKSKEYTTKDIAFWNKFGITKDTLDLYNVKSLEYYWVEGNRFHVKDEYVFAYSYGNYLYKIYQPYNTEWKWIGNIKSDVVQGYKQLPFDGELLFITSSLKDVMTLKELGYLAVAPASESTLIPDKIIKELKIRFDKIYIYYDNDNPGLNLAKVASEQYQLPYIYHPICFKDKDPSDLYKNQGKEVVINTINKLIKCM